jgi:hypothetical protein
MRPDTAQCSGYGRSVDAKVNGDTHDATPGKRRMTGTIVGTKLGGLEKFNGKFIDVTASFDMDFSCGVK